MSLSRFRETVLSYRPAGYWPLNDASGTTAFDISGNGRHGTYTSTYSLAGAVTPYGSRALKLSGGGFVEIADDSAFTVTSAGMTLVSLIRPDTATAGPMWIMTKGSGAGYEWASLIGSSNQAQGILWDSSGNDVAKSVFATSPTFNVGQWHLFVFCYPGTTTSSFPQLIVDGQQIAPSSTSTSGSGVSDTGSVVRIGHRGDNGGVIWDGGISECAIIPQNIGVRGAENLAAALSEGGHARPRRGR